MENEVKPKKKKKFIVFGTLIVIIGISMAFLIVQKLDGEADDTVLNETPDTSDTIDNSQSELAYHETCDDETFACSIAKLYSEDGVNGLYYHDGEGDYDNANLEAGDKSYRFSGGDYEIAEAYQGTYSQIYDEMILLTCNGQVFNNFCSSYNYYFTLAYDSNNTQYTSIKDVLEQAISDGYLTDNIKNYVCFGSDEEVCPDDNLYRIIGLFDDDGDGIYNVKLIKYEYATSDLLGTDGDYYSLYSNYDLDDEVGSSYGVRYKGDNYYEIAAYFWNWRNYDDTYDSTSYLNIWSYSALNTINLNTNFLNNIGDAWSGLIEDYTWKVGGADESIISSPVTTAYQYEILNPNSDIEKEITAKVGLMYVTDYGYAAAPTYWTTSLSDYGNETIRDNNWMYMGEIEWTISRVSSKYPVFLVYYSGDVGCFDVGSEGVAVRPTFYLESSVELSGGTGTQTDPYRIKI